MGNNKSTEATERPHESIVSLMVNKIKKMLPQKKVTHNDDQNNFKQKNILDEELFAIAESP